MRSNWRYRLAGAAAAIAFIVGPAQLMAGPAAHAATVKDIHICPHGTHWDDVLHACV
jgi:hypothetical protein